MKNRLIGNKVTVTFTSNFLGKKSPEVTVTCSNDQHSVIARERSLRPKQSPSHE